MEIDMTNLFGRILNGTVEEYRDAKHFIATNPKTGIGLLAAAGAGALTWVFGEFAYPAHADAKKMEWAKEWEDDCRAVQNAKTDTSSDDNLAVVVYSRPALTGCIVEKTYASASRMQAFSAAAKFGGMAGLTSMGVLTMLAVYHNRKGKPKPSASPGKWPFNG